MLGIGGAGRATELLLRGLGAQPPAGPWTLWGPEAVRAYLWEGASWVPSQGSPTALGGQRQVLAVPRHDVALYMHQVRPLRPGPSVTLMHDTIQLRHGKRATPRWVKSLFLRAAASLTDRVLTVSEYSKTSLHEDLGIAPERIRVLTYPVDPGFVQRIETLRRSHQPRAEVLYVGRFAPHKNLERLVRAFPHTDAYRAGAVLRLVGGDAEEAKALHELASVSGLDRLETEGVVKDRRLEELYATSLCLVMPSLEEGFGLPVWEAMSCGLPVASSNAGSLPEVGGDHAFYFDPRSTADMAAAIDRACARTDPPPPPPFPSIERYTQVFLEELAVAVADR